MTDARLRARAASGRKSLLHRWLLLCALLALLAGCLPGAGTPTETPVPSPAPTQTPAPTATPTVVWFPPTSTPTPLVSAAPSPTTFPMPVFGETLLTDEFSEPDLWALSQSARGSAALGVNELTIVLNEPRAYISATRVDVYLTDFYLETNATTSLCAGQDEYGLVLRAAAPSDFYRFSLSCDGRLRLDRIQGGTASSPLPWMPSSAVPRNAPATVKIGVWADGDEMHFFLNDAYQVTVRTPLIPGGTIGYFARSAGDNAVTVNFSELVVRSVTEAP